MTAQALERRIVIVNLVVDLAGQSFENADEAAILARSGSHLINRRGLAADDVAWIRRHFGGRWHEEAQASWNWIARNAVGTVGFASYGQRSFRWWWLEHWWDRPDVGIFGPTGVRKESRGLHLGVILARRALGSLKAMGFAEAVIPAAGPLEFYERHCGARVAERFERRPVSQ
jgi:hypothetical protein